MELTLKPHPKNTYPLKALLIRGSRVIDWVHELQRLQLSLRQVDVYPVPGLTPNSVWGCLVVLHENRTTLEAGRHEWCQQMHPNVYLAENSVLHPTLTDTELERLFGARVHVIHPEFGFAELTEKIAFENLLQAPRIVSLDITKPQASVVAPQRIRSFRIQPVSLEETLQKLEAAVVPQKEAFQDKPLSWWEKIKLFFYRLLLVGGLPFAAAGAGKSGRMGTFWNKLFSQMQSGTPKWMQSVQQDFEDLEKRNQKFVNKLMDMLQKNPLEALKYAIPLDDTGMSRGSSQAGAMDWSMRWFDFSLFGGGGSGAGSGGSVSIGDQYYELQRQYQETAKRLLEQKEYQKAAFIYMKLLKNYPAAAQALEAGRYYQEAAAIYLNYLKDKRKAAECYEKGNMPLEAIELYKELDENEKAGDLYKALGNKKEAYYYYEQAIGKLKTNHQYVKASLVYRHKMDNHTDAQELLLEGWRLEKDAFNCLNNYFANIQDIKHLQQSIETVYQTEVQETNREMFLQILEHEYAKHTDLQQPVRDMAYEIAVAHLPVNPKVVLQLEKFNPDKQLLKDLMLFSHTHRRQK
jgi:tetratricopeptide (TPR) repeat protein